MSPDIIHKVQKVLQPLKLSGSLENSSKVLISSWPAGNLAECGPSWLMEGASLADKSSSVCPNCLASIKWVAQQSQYQPGQDPIPDRP